MIKPIETVYNSYRFRSRLEARWAVFFDALEVEYEYEKEGFDLGEYGWYLPDFWLPRNNTYLEIKSDDLRYVVPKQFFGTKKGQELLSSVEKCVVLSFKFNCCLALGDPLDVRCIWFLKGDMDNSKSRYHLVDMKKWLLWPLGAKAARQARFEHGETPKVRMNND